MHICMAVTDFIFLGSKIPLDSDCSHEIKVSLLFGRKAMTKQDSVLNTTDTTLLTNIHKSQSYGVFSSHVWL